MEKIDKIDDMIERAYATRTVDGQSGRVQLHSEVDRHEGEMLHDIVRDDPSVVTTLEVGCAYGLSALYICRALMGRPGASHTAIDPFQATQWDNAGVRQVRAAGVDFFSMIEEPSELALPRLLAQHEGGYDLIFIDGWHTFDHTMLDCFYATRLLRVGGYLVIDDVGLPSVRRAVNYVAAYPCYRVERALPQRPPDDLTFAQQVARQLLSRRLYQRLFGRSLTFAALKKIGSDRRPWNWYTEYF